MNNIEQISLDKNLQKHIQKSGLTLNAIAKKLNLNKSSLHGYLVGGLPQGLPALIKLADYFEVSIGELVFGVTLPPQESIQQDHSIKEGRYEITIKKIENNEQNPR